METLRTAARVTMSQRAVSNSAVSPAAVMVESAFMLSDRRLYDRLSAKMALKWYRGVW